MDKDGCRQKITHGWNAKEVQIDRWYCDGYARVDDRQIVFEYNGCAYHSCERCRQVRISKNDEEPRKRFFQSLPNTTLITTSSCEWHAEKFEIDFEEYTPAISPLLFKKSATASDFVKLVSENRLYGFMVVDLEKGPGSEKWRNLNWPPIIQKSQILHDDLPAWMKNFYDRNDFPMESIVQRMQAKKLLLHTSLVKFYVENGFYVSKVHRVFEYQGERCFQNVFKTVYEARVQATETNDDIKATAVKLVSNSMYGSLLLVSQFLKKVNYTSLFLSLYLSLCLSLFLSLYSSLFYI